RGETCVAVAGGLRISVGVKRRAAVTTVAGPKAAARHFMRIGLRDHPARKIGCGALRRRSSAAGKARHCQVETTPKKMHGARLADEARAKLVHDAASLR